MVVKDVKNDSYFCEIPEILPDGSKLYRIDPEKRAAFLEMRKEIWLSIRNGTLEND